MDDEGWEWSVEFYRESIKSFWLVRSWSKPNAYIAASHFTPQDHPFYQNNAAAQAHVTQLAEQGDPLASRAIRHVMVMRSRARG